MAKTLVIDNVQVMRLQFMQDSAGNVQVYTEYCLRAGEQIIQMKHRDITSLLGNARGVSIRSLVAAIVQDITVAELS